MEYSHLTPILRVSRLCFGSLTVGPLQANLPVERGAEVMAYAISNGVNFIDTAQLYENYAYIRRALEISGHPDVVLSSKTYAYTREMAEDAVEEARQKTDRDIIDIFMLHEQESEHTLRGHAEALDYLFECRERGIIRAVGISTHHVAAIRGILSLGLPLDVVHPIYNKRSVGIADGDTADMRAAMEDAKAAGIGIFAMKALGGGHLIADAKASFDFVLDTPCVDAVAVGMQSEEEVDANIAYFESRSFPKAAEAALAQKHRRLIIEDYCLACGACARRCRRGALHTADGVTVCDHDKCVLCGYCVSACPVFAIKVI